MDTKELRNKSVEELQVLLKEWREDVRRMRFEAASGSLKLVHKINAAKKSIARALTILKEKQAK